MRSILRRARGILGTAVTWALGWIPFGAVWGVLDWLVGTDANALWFLVVAFAGFFSVMGFVVGAAFALLLTSFDRDQLLQRASTWRFAAWGGLAGAAISGALLLTGGEGMVTSVASTAFVAVLGAASAATSLQLAISAEPERSLLAKGNQDQLGDVDSEMAASIPRGSSKGDAFGERPEP